MAAPDLLAQMRPVFWNPVRDATTCVVCTRPVEEHETTCSTCRGHQYFGRPLADLVIPLTYAPRGSQAMTDTYNYKDDREAVSRGAQRRLFALFSEALTRHAQCIAQLSPAPRVVTAVPSSKGRTPHPIDRPISRLRTYKPLLRYIGPDGDQRARRVYDPARWEVLDDVSGLHVLLVDDTWVSGVRIQSCATALREAGAERVSALVLARHLDTYGAAPAFLEAHRTRIWDPDICPVTGVKH